jgi:oligoendopeptidase F
MSQSTLPVVFTILALFGITLVGLAQERDREKIPDKYKWNVADIYPADAAWRSAKEKIAAEIPSLGQYRGKLMSSARTLADALETMSRLDKEISRLFVYASLLADQDTRDSMRQGMRQEMTQLSTAFNAEAAFIEPEILRADKATLEKFVAAEPPLTIYRMYLDDIVRRAAHTLSEAEEKILAGAGPMAGSPASIFNILSNADFPYPTVSISDGRAVKLDQAAFNDLRALPNRADREKVMSAFFQSLGSFGRTYGTTMNGEAQKLLFFAKARNYASSLELALDAPNVPISVYTRLIDTCGCANACSGSISCITTISTRRWSGR